MMPALIDYLVALDLHLGNLRVYQRGEGCHGRGVNEVAIMVENVNVDIDNLDCLPLLKYQRFHVDSLGFSDPSVYHSRDFDGCFARGPRFEGWRCQGDEFGVHCKNSFVWGVWKRCASLNLDSGQDLRLAKVYLRGTIRLLYETYLYLDRSVILRAPLIDSLPFGDQINDRFLFELCYRRELRGCGQLCDYLGFLSLLGSLFYGSIFLLEHFSLHGVECLARLQGHRKALFKL